MSLRRAYAPMLPEFDTFLFASVGDEVDGVPLSVLSALSRLGLDPRDEAARPCQGNDLVLDTGPAVGCDHVSDLLSPASVSAGHHSARRLATYPALV